MKSAFSKSTTKSTMRRCSMRSSTATRSSLQASAAKSPWSEITQTLLYSSTFIGMVCSSCAGSCAGSRDAQRLLQVGQLPRLVLVVAQQLAELLDARAKERLGQPRVELRAAAPADFRQRDFERQRLAIRAVGGHRVEAVGQAQDAPHRRDVFAGESGRIALAVVALMVVEHARDD